jgi:hypothetical protein
MGRKQPWDIFEKPPRRRERFCDADEFVEEAGAIAAEPGALPGDTDVLAWEAAAEEIKTARVLFA